MMDKIDKTYKKLTSKRRGMGIAAQDASLLHSQRMVEQGAILFDTQWMVEQGASARDFAAIFCCREPSENSSIQNCESKNNCKDIIESRHSRVPDDQIEDIS
jgi:hypothetical protein